MGLRENNLLGEHHFRYKRYGGVAYHHICGDYIALFSHFIACGVWEAVYILDALLKQNTSRSIDTLHADTQGQSEPVFALAHLLGINLNTKGQALHRKILTCLSELCCREIHPKLSKSWFLIGENHGPGQKYQICVEETPYYHVVSRCVRRAFLCGDDRMTGRSFEHRRKWVAERMKFLAKLFAIDICAYAIMSNHFHIVLKVSQTKDWSDKRVLMTWAGIFDLPLLCERFVRGEHLSQPEMNFVTQKADTYRKRLMDISWFMKCLNEYIARRANIEDGCTGHFWESRFKSQALLDERALLTCMAYVDLNPIRAAMAHTPEASDYTSIQERIKFRKTSLIGFGHDDNNDLSFSLSGYLDLIDYSGRIFLKNKRGSVPENLSPILDRLNLDPETWIDELKRFKSIGFSAVGTVDQLKQFCKKIDKKFAVAHRLKPVLE